MHCAVEPPVLNEEMIVDRRQATLHRLMRFYPDHYPNRSKGEQFSDENSLKNALSALDFTLYDIGVAIKNSTVDSAPKISREMALQVLDMAGDDKRSRYDFERDIASLQMLSIMDCSLFDLAPFFHVDWVDDESDISESKKWVDDESEISESKHR